MGLAKFTAEVRIMLYDGKMNIVINDGPQDERPLIYVRKDTGAYKKLLALYEKHKPE